jgi:hypothetical protein
VKLHLCGCQRSDQTLQTLVYKVVPGLYQAELQRRREFSACIGGGSSSSGDLLAERSFYSPEDSISLSLEYYDRLVAGRPSADC